MKESTFKKHCLVIDNWFVNGRNGVKAYQSIYKSAYNTADTNFRTILENTRILKYIKMKENKIKEEHNITLNSQIKLLQNIISDKDASNRDKISAIREQNKLVGLYNDHNKQKSKNLSLGMAYEAKYV